MARRNRKRDRSKARHRPECQYIPGEAWQRRHARRKDFAKQREQIVREFCAKRGLTLTINNDNHHWIFRLGNTRGVWAEWWPSSAKLVFGQDYDRGVHVHDHAQLLPLLANELGALIR